MDICLISDQYLIYMSNTIKIINPPGLFNPAPYGFSHVVTVPAGKAMVFIAGQGGEDEQGRLDPDFRAQAAQVFNNLRTALSAAQAGADDVVKITSLIVDHDEEKLAVLIEECKRMWPSGNFPVNTLIPVPRLALTGMLIEVDATVVR